MTICLSSFNTVRRYQHDIVLCWRRTAPGISETDLREYRIECVSLFAVVIGFFVFNRWQSNVTDWVRLVFSFLTVCACLILLVTVHYTSGKPGTAIGMALFTVVMVLGLSLWMAQVVARRNRVGRGLVTHGCTSRNT